MKAVRLRPLLQATQTNPGGADIQSAFSRSLAQEQVRLGLNGRFATFSANLLFYLV